MDCWCRKHWRLCKIGLCAIKTRRSGYQWRRAPLFRTQRQALLPRSRPPHWLAGQACLFRRDRSGIPLHGCGLPRHARYAKWQTRSRFFRGAVSAVLDSATLVYSYWMLPCAQRTLPNPATYQNVILSSIPVPQSGLLSLKPARPCSCTRQASLSRSDTKPVTSWTASPLSNADSR